jgi:ABC-type multidrug transport system fused ATPase/permease subunit
MLVMLRSLSYGQQLQQAWGSMSASLPFVSRFHETVAQYELAPASNGSERPAAAARIDARDVGFAYAEGRPVLEGLSFSIEPGEMVGVLGPSGAGKSTLVQLLLGVRDVTEGSLMVAGSDLRGVDRSWWNHRVALVAQDALLFSGSVADNIRFFRDDISDDDVRRAAGLAHVLADIEALPMGLDTSLGERGSQLSGGQRQRISIARALVGRPEILVLDEPTSALDVHSELLVRQTLADLHGSTTVIVIAHRLSTLEICDRLFVIEEGRLVASGSPQELRTDNAFYRRALQLSGMA